jgi:hypothetical protein
LLHFAFPDVETTAVNTQFTGQPADVITEFHSPDRALAKLQGIPFLLAHLTLSIPWKVSNSTLSHFWGSAAVAASKSPPVVRKNFVRLENTG